MASSVFATLNSLIYFAVAISALMWLQFLLVIASGRQPRFDPRIEPVPRRRPFWTAAEFLVMFGVFFLTANGLRAFFLSQGLLPPPSESQVNIESLNIKLVIGILAGLIALTVAIVHVLIIRRDIRHAIFELGFTIRDRSIRRGLAASLWLLPPVGLLSLAVSWLVVPYNHEVLNVLKALADEPSAISIGLLFLGTAVVTPLVEEFMFRVLLQGGLQGMIDIAEIAPSEIDTTESGTIIHASSWTPSSWWPIMVTSVLFAMVHIGQGAAPIPLFFLSVGLGYLYRQTGSIVPPLIVHMVLNGTTLMVEFTRLLAE